MNYTNCIKERFDGYFVEMPEKEREIASANCAIVLDFIGAGKIKNEEMQELLNKAINAEFESEEKLLEYIANIRAPRKKREMSQQTKDKNFEAQLKKLCEKYGKEYKPEDSK